MEEKDWMTLLSSQNQIQKILEVNQKTARYGLELTEADAKTLSETRNSELRRQQRIEFGEGILPKLIDAFCDSPYMDQGTYVETLIRLQEIFFLYKNEMLDEISDDELLQFMREQYDEICFGDLDYLEGTCLNHFAQAIRAGYRGFRVTLGRGEYFQFDEFKRWDHELYLEVLKDLCWR